MVDELRLKRHEEESLFAVLDAVPGGVVRVAKDGRTLHTNRTAGVILGCAPDAASGPMQRTVEVTVVQEDGTEFPHAELPAVRVLATGRAAGPVTLGIRHPDGATYWAILRAIPVYVDNELDGAVVTFLDITERKRADEARRVSEAMWRSLAENLPSFVVIANREARIESINRVLPQFEHDAVVGSSTLNYLEPTCHEDWLRTFRRALDERAITRLENRGEGPDGRAVWYETQFVPILDGDAPVERVLVVANDITERRMMLASLAEKERLASVGMVAASVAHEIMNPLTYVLANLDLALSDRFTDEAKRGRALREAREGAARMQQIVWDLRSLGRAGGEELFYVDPRSVLETSLRLSGVVANRLATVDLDLSEVPGVLANESRLCQVFINLIVNAAQSMAERPTQDRTITVKTRHDEARSMVAVRVSDLGAGIPQERITRIFEPFYTTKSSGTGLGLSISKDIVERMGGRIEVESQIGVGSTFTVWLSTMPRHRKDAPSA